jgi:hypothetical protein
MDRVIGRDFQRDGLHLLVGGVLIIVERIGSTYHCYQALVARAYHVGGGSESLRIDSKARAEKPDCSTGASPSERQHDPSDV